MCTEAGPESGSEFDFRIPNSNSEFRIPNAGSESGFKHHVRSATLHSGYKCVVRVPFLTVFFSEFGFQVRIPKSDSEFETNSPGPGTRNPGTDFGTMVSNVNALGPRG